VQSRQEGPYSKNSLDEAKCRMRGESANRFAKAKNDSWWIMVKALAIAD
jgi:hypothetical protein